MLYDEFVEFETLGFDFNCTAPAVINVILFLTLILYIAGIYIIMKLFEKT